MSKWLGIKWLPLLDKEHFAVTSSISNVPTSGKTAFEEELNNE